MQHIYNIQEKFICLHGIFSKRDLGLPGNKELSKNSCLVGFGFVF